jgi:hypothetical protein
MSEWLCLHRQHKLAHQACSSFAIQHVLQHRYLPHLATFLAERLLIYVKRWHVDTFMWRTIESGAAEFVATVRLLAVVVFATLSTATPACYSTHEM